MSKFPLCLVLVTIALWGGRAPILAAPQRPNILLIVVDDLGWSDVGCYGSDLHETPNIDRLALRSVRFTDAYAAAPVCTPTRASIMTGKYPARLHMTIWHEASRNPPQNRKLIPPITQGNLPLDQVTIAEVLQQAGYYTAHVGKWHLGDAAHYPEAQGFDANIGGTFWGAPSTFFYPYRGRWGRSQEIRYVPHLEGGKTGEYLTDRLTDEAICLLQRIKDQPFFLQLAYHTVHTPIEAKPAVVEHYRGKLKADFHHQNPVFAAMVHSLDENVGRVVAKLDELGVADNTVVIFTSDNGGYVNQYRGTTVTNNYPLRSGKGSLYEGGVRVATMIRWPGQTPSGAVCRHPIMSTDFYPTILEIAGLPGDAGHNAHVDGHSIVPLLKDPGAELQREALFFHYPHYYATTSPVGAVRMGDWKLLEYFEDDRVELYNLRDDLGEGNNLAQERPDRTAHMRDRLRTWRKTIDAQMPRTNPKTSSNPRR